MTYINSAVLAVKDSDKDTYREMAAGMAGMKALMADPAIMDMNNDRPFDAARMLHGSFETIVQA